MAATWDPTSFEKNTIKPSFTIYKIDPPPEQKAISIKKTKTPNHRKRRKGWE